ncbi:MAG: Eco57I restriction-modification methylase domain-containing protein, partial [Armatimonadetes bacterium]|nr:Eco57I restriction-modification methylase domain-containing protein [Armatimonadota bacterium]
REEAFPDSLLVFSDCEQLYWHFTNPRFVTARDQQTQGRRQRYVLRRISVGPEDKLRTAVERFSMISLAHADPATFSPAAIHELHDKAFNVEQVTEAFFQDFKDRFIALQDVLHAATEDFQWAHDYALRLLSRIMFVYFIQRKRWLGGDPHFMASYWKTYLDSRSRGEDRFLDDWLYPLFFEAFASPAEASLVTKRDYMPDEVRETLRNAPYLNGGLFSRDDLDRRYLGHYRIPDDYFATLLDPTDGFFERYNFTIAEDSPLDQEVAVDPEMIGRVYETLVNISEPGSELAEDREQQRRAGIFYTPRTEIDLMCRLALSDYLRHHLGDEHRDLIYELVFAYEPDEKQQADTKAAALDLWPQLDELVRDVTVVDPACGSGSFLVGMMNILADLRARANEQVGHAQTDYERKREIIRENLYGVDVMPWAVEIAELRLWLQLVVHTELDRAELRGVMPLLPNLTFKIRCGDSLVEEIAGVNLAHLTAERKGDPDVPKSLKGELRQLKSRKLRFYDAKLSEHQAAEEREAIRNQERHLFCRILAAKAEALQGGINEINRMLSHSQHTLTGEAERALSKADQERYEAERTDLEQQLERIQAAQAALPKAKDVPFVWDMAFAEIFSGDQKGFDIVIGNPPYVRQEKIADPQHAYGQQSAEERREYKAKLERSVYHAFPGYFGSPERPKHKLSGRSDLYVYFYFHALGLLNPQGAFCFITSNSWLDVDYGAALQEFLARQVPIHMVLDNQVKRSFAQADINTVIVLLGAPVAARDGAITNVARFVMAQVPFEQMLHPVIFEEIDGASKRRTFPEYRIHPIAQRELLEAGVPPLAEEEAPRKKRGVAGPLVLTGKYEGDKWGGKYLRAPDIYYEILEAAGDKLVPLGEIAEIRRGFTTGANEFFYLEPTGQPAPEGLVHVRNAAGWEGFIEARFLRPLVKGPDDFQAISTPAELFTTLVFACHGPPPVLRGTAAAEYLAEGQRLGIHARPTCASRPWWYSLPRQSPPPMFVLKGVWLRHFTPRNTAGALCDQQLYAVYPRPGAAELALAAANTSFWALQAELSGRVNFGEGVLWLARYEVARLRVLDEQRVAPACAEAAVQALHALEHRTLGPMESEIGHPDRLALDGALLEAVGLPSERAKELQGALAALVRWRRGRAGGQAEGGAVPPMADGSSASGPVCGPAPGRRRE